MAAPHTSTIEQKRALRGVALAQRARWDPAVGENLAGYWLPSRFAPPPGATVAGFWPLPGEIDVRPLLLLLHARGHLVCLPTTPAKGQALSFHPWRPGVQLHPGRFGTMHSQAAAVAPDVVLTPLLAFDRQGGRLGYGGGYYDRSLAALPGRLAIGCAFSGQEVAHVPTEPTDIRLHAVVTERGVIGFS